MQLGVFVGVLRRGMGGGGGKGGRAEMYYVYVLSFTFLDDVA